jgi:GT2 family glycosyltransferase
MFMKNSNLSTDLSTRIPHIRSIFVILVHFGAKEVTDRALSSLMAGSKQPDHCIVVDHAEIPYKAPMGVHVVRSTKNSGYAAGLLVGIHHAKSLGAKSHDICVLANNDLVFDSAGIEHLAQWWSERFSNTLAGISWGALSLITGRAIITGSSLSSSLLVIPYIHGSCMVLEWGYAMNITFPTDLFMYWEDVALSLRVKRMCGVLERIPFPLAAHSDTPEIVSAEKLYFLVRNGAYVLEHELLFAWRLWWKSMNTLRRMYHALCSGSSHKIVLRALKDATTL